MALIVVWAKGDNDHADPSIDARKLKRGMVVDVLEDNQSPGWLVESSPWFRTITVPGRASFYAYLLDRDPEPDDPAAAKAAAEFPRKRLVTLDLDAIEQAAGILSPGDRPAEVIALGGKVAIDARLSAVAKRPNPNVLLPLKGAA